LGKYNVGKKYQHTATYNRIGACLAHLNGTATHIVSVKRRDGGYDEGEEQRFYDAAPDVPLRKFILKTIGQVGRGHYSGEY
jgi:hypothetical protein